MLIPVETVQGRWSKCKTWMYRKIGSSAKFMARIPNLFLVSGFLLEKTLVKRPNLGGSLFQTDPDVTMFPAKSSQTFQVWLVCLSPFLLFQQGVPNLE